VCIRPPKINSSSSAPKLSVADDKFHNGPPKITPGREPIRPNAYTHQSEILIFWLVTPRFDGWGARSVVCLAHSLTHLLIFDVHIDIHSHHRGGRRRRTTRASFRKIRTRKKTREETSSLSGDMRWPIVAAWSGSSFLYCYPRWWRLTGPDSCHKSIERRPVAAILGILNAPPG
jgi:hypothetical protein